MKNINLPEPIVKGNNEKTSKYKYVLRFVFTMEIVAIIIVLWAGFNLLRGNNGIQFLKWYGILLLCTIVGFPITHKLFSKFFDDGYIFAKPIGIAISSFAMWIFASFKILKFNTINSYLCLGVMLIISCMLSIKEFKKLKGIRTSEYKKEKLKKKILIYLIIEIGFLLVFILASYVKGFKPDASCGQEKYMDFGFMKIMDKSDYMPAEDMWLSGHSINYYYFGQYIATYITKISTVGVEYGYNFSLITIVAITFFASFSIVFNLLKIMIKDENSKSIVKEIIPLIGGGIAALSNTIAGNMHYVLYGLLKILPSNFDSYSINNGYRYSNSTRYIGYNPDVNDKTISEFPSYSFVISDLHAHVVNIIFVLTVIALLLAYVFSKRKIINRIRKEQKGYLDYSLKEFALKELLNPIIIAIGFFIGIFKMTNFWDFPIYLVVSFGILFTINFIVYKKKWFGIVATFIQIIEILLISTIVSLPFSLTFVKMASEIKFTTKHSQFYQLMILWGFPSILVIYFIINYIIKAFKKNGKKVELESFLNLESISNMFVIIIGICAIGLVIVPEIVYVKDIYGDTYQRANTMFKMTYQAYILFSLCFGFILTKLNFVRFKKNIINHIVGFVAILLFVMTLEYGEEAIFSYYGNVFNAKNYVGLNATTFLGTNYSGTFDDKAMIDWLNENSMKNENIVEAACYSYSYGNTISVFTGLSTPIGWHTHEWLWRSSNSSTNCPEIVEERSNDVKNFYECNKIELDKQFVRKYDIDYIIVGNTERTLYKVNEETLKKLGKIVFESNKDNENGPSYIIKCER